MSCSWRLCCCSQGFFSFRLTVFPSLVNGLGNHVICITIFANQVSPSGWSEGECKGKAGWFPSAYVENRQRIPARNAAAEAY